MRVGFSGALTVGGDFIQVLLITRDLLKLGNMQLNEYKLTLATPMLV
jgi:hypothetical protein